jgi:hypothetical protein
MDDKQRQAFEEAYKPNPASLGVYQINVYQVHLECFQLLNIRTK